MSNKLSDKLLEPCPFCGESPCRDSDEELYCAECILDAYAVDLLFPLESLLV